MFRVNKSITLIKNIPEMSSCFVMLLCQCSVCVCVCVCVCVTWPIWAIQQVWLIVQTVQSYQQMWSRLHRRLPVCCLTMSSRWQQHISETNRTEGHKMWSGHASPQDVRWWRQNVIYVCFCPAALIISPSPFFFTVCEAAAPVIMFVERGLFVLNNQRWPTYVLGKVTYGLRD